MKIIGSQLLLIHMPMPKPKHTDNESIVMMHEYLTLMFRSTADHIQKNKLSPEQIIDLLRELADESEAQIVVVKLRDNL
jgi:hypothetical protein